MYAVILAGGGGTRLWPLSRPDRPKPFLPLLGERTLLQLTADRLAGLVAPADVTVVTERRYAGLVRDQLPGAAVVAEPEGRNTAAAVALAAAAVERPDGEPMLVLPADHLVLDEAGFRAVLAAAGELAGGGLGVAAPLITLGVRPSGPESGYGYIVPAKGGETVRGRLVQRVARFVEKPDRAVAEELLAGSRPASWNAGIFCWQRGAIRLALARHAPDVHAGVVAALSAGQPPDPDAYGAIRSISIDYAVLEPAAARGEVLVLPIDVGWSDLGSWTVLLQALGAGPAVSGRVVQPGEGVELGPDDLLLSRTAAGLALRDGPGTMDPDEAPRALLRHARPDARLIEALLRRVAKAERREQQT